MKFEKLSNCFYGANLLLGSIDINPTHTWSFYYIVENTSEREIVEKEALKTILIANKHSRRFHFYGKQAQFWENSFDLADVRIRPNASYEEVALTVVYNEIDEFVDELKNEISVRSVVPHDVYLIYDDECIYKQILSKLNY